MHLKFTFTHTKGSMSVNDPSLHSEMILLESRFPSLVTDVEDSAAVVPIAPVGMIGDLLPLCAALIAHQIIPLPEYFALFHHFYTLF